MAHSSRSWLRCLCTLLLVTAACGGSERDRDRDSTPSSRDAGRTSDAGDEDAGVEEDAGTVDAGNEDGGQTLRPTATVETPSNSGGLIAVSYRLFHPGSEPLSIEVQWSSDAITWHNASLSTPTTDLESSPEGVDHQLVWQSAVDIPAALAIVDLRLTPSSATERGETVRTNSFTVDNRRANTTPVVTWSNVPNPASGDVPLGILVSDAESDPVRVTVQVNADGQWQNATLSSTTIGLAANSSGVEHQLTWSSAADIADNLTDVQLRVQVDDGFAKSPWVGSARFDVRNAGGSPTGVQITEINLGAEPWFELENFGTVAVDLRNWTVREVVLESEDTDPFPDHTASPSPILLAPGARLVVSSGFGTSTGTTLYLDNVFGWGVARAGAIELLDENGVHVDFVRWGGSTTTPQAGTGWTEAKRLYIPHAGASLKRKTSVDRDNASDFCAAPVTKGAANDTPCYPEASATSRVRLVEISQAADSPAPSGSDSPQWVELLNTGASTDLTNWSIRAIAQGFTKVYVLRSVQLAQNGRIVVRSASSGADSSGLQYAGVDAFGWRAGGWGSALLMDPAGNPVDFVRWGGMPGEPPAPLQFTETTPLWAPDASTTIARQPETSTDQSASSWCLNQPSPKAANGACYTPPDPSTQVIINEVASGSWIVSTYAYIEIRNISSSPVSVNGWKLRWGATSSSTWTLTDSTPLAAGARRVYYECGWTSNPPAGCSGSLPWGQLGSNTPGFVELLDNRGTSADFMKWGGATATPTNNPAGWSEPPTLGALSGARSYGRVEANADTNKAWDWCLQDATAGASNGFCK